MIQVTRLKITRVGKGSYNATDKITGAEFDIDAYDGLWRWAWAGDNADDESRTKRDCVLALEDYLKTLDPNNWRIAQSIEVKRLSATKGAK